MTTGGGKTAKITVHTELQLTQIPTKTSMNAKTLLQLLARCAGLLLTGMVLTVVAAPVAPKTTDTAKVTATLTPETGRMIIDAQGVPPPAPLFFSATAEQSIRLSATECLGEAKLKLHVIQGRPEVLTLGLVGEGEVMAVSGKNLRDWSVRQEAGTGKRLLDIRPLLAKNVADPVDLDLVVSLRGKKTVLPGNLAVVMVVPGEAVGFSSKIIIQTDLGIEARVALLAGMLSPSARNDGREPLQFVATGEGQLEVKLLPRGGSTAAVESVDVQLTGRLAEAGTSMAFRMRCQLRSQTAGARLRILDGTAALTEKTAGDGWHVDLSTSDGGDVGYDLVSDRAGVVAVDLSFVAEVREKGDWRSLEFSMPAGSVVPMQLDGMGADISFNPDSPIVPMRVGQAWRGYLPASGKVSFAWKRTRAETEGTLFFTSSEQTEVRVGSGLMRQVAQLRFLVLQGKLSSVRCRLEGAGEILGVEGANVLGWKIVLDGVARVLEVQFSRPVEGEGVLVVNSQAALASFPVRAEPLRLIPEGVVRHAGFVRVAGQGAVRLEVADVSGMMQLAPGQFPGAALDKNARQVFVYRFPSAAYGYSLLAAQIQPEVAVSAIVTYELADTDRAIEADLELDVREAPLRDWSLAIPEGFTVSAVTGADVADYVVESLTVDGYRILKIVFRQAVEGRQLLQVRLEKNQTAAAGEWHLPALKFPNAKTVRGHVGAVSTPGYRLVSAKVDRLVEVPLSYFPKQIAGLQQAWRLRDADWSADLRIEALGQSIQADAFHLYSIKEGIVYGSVLLNYFVVGSPASEWRIEVPQSLGNIDIVGQNVRRDWRREGDQVIVSLHQPVLGATTLLITFEQPISGRGGTIQPGQVRPLGVQSERGYIEVVSPLQVKHEVRSAEGGLLKLEAMELPAEFRVLTSSPALGVYQYTTRPFKLEMGLEWYAQGETVDQVVDFAKLSSQVSRDGQVVTDVRYFVKTRGQKALRMILPEGAKLWEARVEGEAINARIDGGQTLIPLPARLNPNEPVAVTLRLGQVTGSSSRIKLIAPRTVAPTVINEWTLHSDGGYLLVPHGGNAEVVQPALTETGFEWISGRGRSAVAGLLCLTAMAALLLREAYGWRVGAGLLLSVLALIMALTSASQAMSQRRANLQQLTYAASMVPAGEDVVVQFDNVRTWQAMPVGWGIMAGLFGVALLTASRITAVRAMKGHALVVPAALVFLSAGLLAQRGGAILFFGAIALAVALFLIAPVFMRWAGDRRNDEPTPPIEPGPGPATVLSAVAILCTLGLGLGSGTDLRAEAPKPPAVVASGAWAAQSMVQDWTINENRLYAEMELIVRGAPGDSFLLLKAPAVLTEFKGDGLRVGKVEQDGQSAYYVTPQREGIFSARVRFEMPVPKLAEGIELPSGPAATQRISVVLDQSGWEFASPMAAQVVQTSGLGENRSGAVLVFTPHKAPVILLKPKRRDTATESAQYFAETANLYVSGPGVVNGYSRITVRPVQGRVSELELEVPKGLTVGDVARGPVGTWRFDPVKRRLKVAVEPAQTKAFSFVVETQLGTGALPFDLTLDPVKVLGASGEVGTLAIAFGGDAQPEGVKTAELSPINIQDFDPTLVPSGNDGRPLATVLQAWRFGQAGGHAELKIAAVAPEVRVATRQILSLDDDRMVMAVNLNVSITRVGLFKLSFVLPEGFEIEALSGAALNQWTEAQDGNRRVVTLHLNGRTIGEQVFSLTLAGAAPGPQVAWAVPRFSLREATRQSGDLLIVPGKGLWLRATNRERVTQVEPRSVGGLQPGTLAFHLLQEDWILGLGIEALEPWVTVQSLQELTIREGQTLARIALRCKVENAAVKQFRIKLPGLSEEHSRTVRATGSAVSDMVRVVGTPDIWEIRFQRGIAGETDVQIEYQGPAGGEQKQESLLPPEFPGARQAMQFVAVRGSGRIELEATTLSRGWSRTDWTAVPTNLQNRSDRGVPALCFRVAEPENPLVVSVRRHNVAEALKLRVTQGSFTTLFSPAGTFLTAAELRVDVVEKSTLRVRLPEGARMFNTIVNGESVSVVREGDAYLFHVSPNAAGSLAATVRLVYACAGGIRGGAVGLVAPSLSVPLENVTWRVVVPPGCDLQKYAGELRLREDVSAGWFGVEQYQTLVVEKRSAEARKAVALLEQANDFLQRGDQQKAGEVLSRVSATQALDEASNEDARVQLRKLKTEQTVLGLNTRRQRLYLDNRADGARNEQLEQAANLNPLMQGKVNFDPKQMDQLLMGNTAEENVSLKGIAARLVDQQLTAEPAPGAIDITVPERGRVLTFTRSLQVDGGAPLELRLTLSKASESKWGFIAFVLAGIAAIAAIPMLRRADGFRV